MSRHTPRDLRHTGPVYAAIQHVRRSVTQLKILKDIAIYCVLYALCIFHFIIMFLNTITESVAMVDLSTARETFFFPCSLVIAMNVSYYFRSFFESEMHIQIDTNGCVARALDIYNRRTRRRLGHMHWLEVG